MLCAEPFYVNAKTAFTHTACGADTRHTFTACFYTAVVMSLQIVGGAVSVVAFCT